MQGSCGFRHAKRGWQRTQESLGQACRHRHSWLMLLAPCLFIFLLLLWTPSVHPGLSVRIEAHTQKFNESHRAMEMSFVAAQDSTRAADVAADGFTLDIVDGLVDSLAAPAPSFAQDDQSAYSGTADSDSSMSHDHHKAEAKGGLQSVGVLQQHLQNASAAAQKATSAAVHTLELIQPSLNLKSNSSSTLFSNSPSSPSMPASTDSAGSASQVHMGFNNTVIHDSYSSGNFSAVNSTDVVPISEMPDQDTPMPSSTPADWAQIIEDDLSDDHSDDLSLPTTSASAGKVDSGSRTQDQMTVDPIGLADIAEFTTELDAHAATAQILDLNSASKSAEAKYGSSQADEELSSVQHSSERAGIEEASPEQLSTEPASSEASPESESDWISVDPYSADLQGMIHPTSRVFRAPGKFPVTRDDLVIAMPTDKRHFPIVEASKAWRKEMRTFVALANETVASGYAHFEDSSEVWGYYPDDEPLKGLHPGDSRAALTPFMAHEAFEGDYKWILYGDDDTFFFVDGVLELLQDFDPSLPYFITDHYWWGDELNESMNYHPHERAPRCLPCHWTQEDEERSLRVDGYRPFQPYIGCPCTAERICKTDDRGYFDDACNMPVWKPDTEGRDFRVYTMHGGAGALMSIGLMERLPLSFMDRCMKDLARSSGGDALISVCLWRAGYAFTDPGYSFYHWEAKSFDPGPENSTALLAYLGDAISNNSDQYSLELLTHMATSHLRSATQGIDGVVQTMQHLADMYDNWRQRVHSVISMTQMHAGQHQKVIPALQATTGIANWRR
ncbi:TPA: hypothetical protein ACH3X3_003441 [Trebouxia sp. C0006]